MYMYFITLVFEKQFMILGRILAKPVKVCASKPLKQIVVESNPVYSYSFLYQASPYSAKLCKRLLALN